MYYGYYDYSPYDMRQNTRIIADLERPSMANILRSNAMKNLHKKQKILKRKKSFKKYVRMKSDIISYLQSYTIL
ncbi:hypothetical protein M2353_001054 [Bacillus aerius]|nr:hypothetical protein [Bacillus aerius]